MKTRLISQSQRFPGLCIGAIAALFAAAGGCSMTLNQDAQFNGRQAGPHSRLPALEPDSQSRVRGEPSVTTFDRRHWPLMTVEVPIRQVEHNPAFLRSRRWAAGDNPAGRYPSVCAALRPGCGCRTQAAGAAAVELLTMPAMWIAATVDSGLGGVDRSPRADESFERMPADQPDYAERWITRPAPMRGTVTDAGQ